MNTIEEEKVTNIRKELIEKKKKNLFKDEILKKLLLN